MFSFRKRRHQVDATPYMRRIIDLTTNGLLRTHEGRHARRYSRALSVAVCPWVKKKAVNDGFSLGITKDISDSGVCILTTTRLQAESVVFTLLVSLDNSSELSFFQADVKRESTRAGFVEYGLQVNQYLNEQYLKETQILEQIIRLSYDEEFDKPQTGLSTKAHPKYT